jgi:hypothetical protein
VPDELPEEQEVHKEGEWEWRTSPPSYCEEL